MSITGKYNGSAAIYGDTRDPRLSTLDVVNKSALVGASLDDALASVSSTLSTGLIPFTFASLAEQDLMSYNAATGRWVNRTVGVACKSTGDQSVAIGPQGAYASSTNGVALGRSASSGHAYAVNIGPGTISAGSNAITIGAFNRAGTNGIGIGGSGLGTRCTAVGNGTDLSGTDNVVVGASAAPGMTGSNNTFVGAGSVPTVVGRTGCVVLGTNCSASMDNTLKIAVGNNTATFESTLVAVAGVGVAIGAEPYLPVTIGGVAYKLALRT